MSASNRIHGLIQVYTGDGKGKTTAALGQAVRALGHGLKVLFVQFVKGNSFTGEFLFAQKVENLDFWQFGRDCIYSSAIRENIIECFGCGECFIGKEGPTDKDLKVVRGGWQKVLNNFHRYDLLILDEISLAIYHGIIREEEVIDLLNSKPEYLEVILTGRYMPESIKEKADLVTEMKEIKHPYQKGIKARWGIDY